MERRQIVLSSTHVDRHGEMMTKEALEMGAETINSGRRPRIGVEHDMTLPPLGRISNAEVIQGEDGEYYLVAYQEFFDSAEELELADGEIVVREYFSTGGTPFAEVQTETSEIIVISIDPQNFENYKDADSFYSELQNESEIEFKKLGLSRKSFISDPEIVFQLAENYIYLFFGYKLAKKILKKTTNKLANKVSDDLAGTYDLIKKGVAKMIKRANPKDRPITYIFEFPAPIQIELIAIDKTPDEIVNSLKTDTLKKLEKKLDELTYKFDTEKIQFELNDQNKWELNYLLTVNGESIGTKKSISKRTVALENTIKKTLERKKKKK
ncbi:MAG: hypothetical protein H6568_11825 [Lewinellaceae bacterium]|nr:hypothetical protein [Lewinellaceae bacterium]HRW97867.1 hypothetical protein [Cyclobacteriaceae bacterium]